MRGSSAGAGHHGVRDVVGLLDNANSAMARGVVAAVVVTLLGIVVIVRTRRGRVTCYGCRGRIVA